MAATKTEQFCFFNVKIALELKVSISLRHKPGAQTSKGSLNVDKCLHVCWLGDRNVGSTFL